MQLFKVKMLTPEKVAHMWFICPRVCMFCFVSRVPWVPSGGEGTVTLGMFPGAVRIPCRQLLFKGGGGAVIRCMTSAPARLGLWHFVRLSVSMSDDATKSLFWTPVEGKNVCPPYLPPEYLICAMFLMLVHGMLWSLLQ